MTAAEATRNIRILFWLSVIIGSLMCGVFIFNLWKGKWVMAAIDACIVAGSAYNVVNTRASLKRIKQLEGK